MSWGTIRSYLSAVRYYQISAGLPDPALTSFPKLPYILKGIRKSTPDCARGKRLPITPDILRKIYTVWAQCPVSQDKVMLWAACCMGFFGFMRAGEFTCSSPGQSVGPTLSVADVSIDSRDDPQVLLVHLRHSKTDPFGAGVYLHLGHSGDDTLCPVTAVLGYLARRPPALGPLFIFEDGSPLTRVRLVSHLREALMRVGINSKNFSGHSFRIGAATTAARAGFSDSFIQTLGRWKSAAFRTYIRTPPEDLQAVAARLTRP